MDVHPPQNGALGYAPWPNRYGFICDCYGVLLSGSGKLGTTHTGPFGFIQGRSNIMFHLI